MSALVAIADLYSSGQLQTSPGASARHSIPPREFTCPRWCSRPLPSATPPWFLTRRTALSH